MENKPIKVLEKPRSKNRIEIWIDYSMDPDGWFLDFRYVEKKSKKISSSHCIIQKDLNTWLSYVKKDGWVESELSNQNI